MNILIMASIPIDACIDANDIEINRETDQNKSYYFGLPSLTPLDITADLG